MIYVVLLSPHYLSAVGAVGLLFGQIKILLVAPCCHHNKVQACDLAPADPFSLSLATLNFVCFSLSTDPVTSAANALSSVFAC